MRTAVIGADKHSYCKMQNVPCAHPTRRSGLLSQQCEVCNVDLLNRYRQFLCKDDKSNMCVSALCFSSKCLAKWDKEYSGCVLCAKDTQGRDAYSMIRRNKYGAFSTELLCSYECWFVRYSQMKDKKTRFACRACGEQRCRIKKCAACEVALYCSTECQKDDWPTHKFLCIPVKDQHRKTGEELKTTRDALVSDSVEVTREQMRVFEKIEKIERRIKKCMR